MKCNKRGTKILAGVISKLISKEAEIISNRDTHLYSKGVLLRRVTERNQENIDKPIINL